MRTNTVRLLILPIITLLYLQSRLLGQTGDTTTARTNTVARKPALPRVAVPVAEPLPTTVRVRVSEATPFAGGYRCVTDHGTVLVLNLPREVLQHLVSVQRLEQKIASAEARYKIDQRAAREADAEAPTSASGNVYYVEAQMAKRERANKMAVDVANQKEDLDDLKTQLQELKSKAVSQATIMAIATPQTYGGLKLWRATGLAPAAKMAER